LALRHSLISAGTCAIFELDRWLHWLGITRIDRFVSMSENAENLPVS
jgi:hypothetical protein